MRQERRRRSRGAGADRGEGEDAVGAEEEGSGVVAEGESMMDASPSRTQRKGEVEVARPGARRVGKRERRKRPSGRMGARKSDSCLRAAKAVDRDWGTP